MPKPPSPPVGLMELNEWSRLWHQQGTVWPSPTLKIINDNDIIPVCFQLLSELWKPKKWLKDNVLILLKIQIGKQKKTSNRVFKAFLTSSVWPNAIKPIEKVYEHFCFHSFRRISSNSEPDYFESGILNLHPREKGGWKPNLDPPGIYQSLTCSMKADTISSGCFLFKEDVCNQNVSKM